MDRGIEEAENYWNLNMQKLVSTAKQVSKNSIHAVCTSRLHTCCMYDLQ